MLPGELSAGIAAALDGVPAKALARAVEGLTGRYRGEARGARPGVRSEIDVLAYLAYRAPATYAAVVAALAETAERRPEWRPRSVLDVGAGPGTAMWAVAAAWPSVESFVLVERDARMAAVGKRLAAGALDAAIRGARWLAADVTAAPELPRCDLVIAGYALGELEAGRLAEVVRRLWDVCGDTMVVVEPGTPRGFGTARAVRDALLALGARTLAPCPHDAACPMSGGRWCHFAARLERSRVHRAAKRAELAYEDEKFSYVAMSRTAGLPIEARVIGHPRAGHGRVELDLCTAEGLRSAVVGRGDREVYPLARRARWGSAIPRRGEDAAGEG